MTNRAESGLAICTAMAGPHAKGTLYKGPFQLPRMLWYCWQRLESGKVALSEMRSTN